MTILKAEKRNPDLKAKQLRRAGIIPGVLYGSRDSESLNIQFSQSDVERFLRTNAPGSRVTLMVGDKKTPALLKEVTHTLVTNKPEHLSFMPLVEGEPITSVAQIILLNRDKAKGNVQQTLFEITYKALPSDLVEKIEIDLEGLDIGESIRVEDLEISKNEAIEIQNLPDTMVLSIVARRMKTGATSSQDEQSDENSSD